MSIFKSTFKPNVQKQIESRQDAISNKRSTPATIQYFNSRNAWIRMTSAVDVAEDGGKLAKSYILQGGILNSNNELRYGVGGAEGKYMSESQSGKPYRLGIRPMPGITGIEVKSKSAYGSLREITVNFNAWDIKQLEELELLYMRPMYSVLIEWGWAPYLDNNGNLQKNVVYYDDIFIKGKKKEDIWKEIFNKAEENGNYEAMYGFIKNYSWSARADGGYDCTVNVISIGEIIESLKVNYSSFDIPNLDKNGIFAKRLKVGMSKEVESSYSKNIIAGLCHELYVIVNEKGDNFAEYNIVDRDNNNKAYTFFKFPIDISGGNESKGSIVKSGKQIYITLESFVDILNKYVLLSDKKNKTALVKLSVHDSDITSENKLLLCLGNTFQLSTNPAVCLIGNDAWKDPASLGIPDSSDFNTLKKIVKGISHKYFYENDYKYKQLGVIGNIYINLDYLYKLITDDSMSSQDKKEKNDIALFDYIKNIMAGVNTSIGNVANFEIHVDPTDGNVAKIIDINYVDASGREDAFDKAFTIEVHNTKSTVRSYKLESQIFPEQSTIAAIGAQYQGGALGSDTSTLIDFNQNLIDRIIPVKESPTSAENNDPMEELKIKVENLLKNFKTLLKFIININKDWWESKGDFDASKSSDYSNALKDIINFYKSFVNNNNKNRSIIPTKLSLILDGIGGVVIGNIFKIPDDLLPRGYKGGGNVGRKLGYTVTGLGHSIRDNDWVTNIEAQTIILDLPTGGLSENDFSIIQKIAAAAKEAINNENSTEATQRLKDVIASIDPKLLPGPAAKDIPSKVNVDKVIAAMQKKNYSFYANTPYGKNKLNIVGVRDNKPFNSPVSNYFTDYIVMFYYDDSGNRNERIGWVTTTPGLYYEASKFGGDGRTIMIAEGQYRDAYARGLHQGKIDTLIQNRPIKYNRDESLDARYNNIRVDNGFFGTNIHPSGNYQNSDPNKLINDWSAGCQVFRSYDDYLWMMQAVRNQTDIANYKFFTYTLLNTADL
jgi:hypothetical protein